MPVALEPLLALLALLEVPNRSKTLVLASVARYAGCVGHVAGGFTTLMVVTAALSLAESLEV